MAIDSVRFNNAVTAPTVAASAPVQGEAKPEANPSFKGEGEEKKGGHLLRNSLIALGVAGAGYLLYKKFNKGAAAKAGEAVEKAVEQAAGKTSDAAKIATEKVASDKRVTSQIAKMDAEIELSELATTPTAHANRERDIIAAFAERDAKNATNAMANAKTAESKMGNVDLEPPAQTLRERADRVIDAKAAFNPIKPTSVSKDGKTVYGKLRSGEEYVITKNKKGEVTQYIVGDGKTVSSTAKTQAFVEKQGIDLSV